jgi:hypothetical protein
MTKGGRADALVAALAGVLALAVYLRSLAPGLLWGDSAEFQFAAWLGGFVHPTGYPLYLILGWLWSHILPLGDPAFRLNLFSAAWGGVAVALLCLVVIRTLRLIGGGGSVLPRVTGLGAALVFTFTPTFWSQAVVAEVYTLHAAFVAAILLSLLAWVERTWAGNAAGARLAWYTGALLLGLSLTHHRTTLLLLGAAGVFVAVVWWMRNRDADAASEDGQAGRPRAAPTMVALLGPLLLYLYIPLRAPQAPYAQLVLSESSALPLYDATLPGFVAHVTGSVFGPALVLGGAFDGWAGLLGRFVDEVSPNGIILGVVGLAWLVVVAAQRRDVRVAAFLALTGITFIAQVAFNQLYAIGDIHVFYIPAFLIWVVWMAAGAYALGLGLRGLIASRWGAVAGVVAVAAVLSALAFRGALTQWPRVQRAGDTTARDAWTALLAAEPETGALLVSNDRDEMTPLWYLKYVEGRRPDLDGLFPLIQEEREWATVAQVAGQALATNRAVYLVKPMTGLDIKFEMGPQTGERRGGLGPLVRLLPLAPEGTAGGEPVATFEDTIRLDGVTFSPDQLSAGGSLAVTLSWQPLRAMGADWTTFVQVINAAGTKIGQSDHPPGGAYYPSSLWVPGEQLRDRHEIELAQELGPRPYRLIVGLYVSDDTVLRHLGSPTEVAELQ